MIKKFLLLLLIPLLLCSCTNKTYETISFASWGSVTETGIINRIIADFEAKNPNIKVNFMHIPQNYFQKIHLMFASNTPPDVIFINNLYLPLYANYLEDLSKYIQMEDFYKPALEGLSYDGKLFAIPRDISNLVFYVNLDKTSMPDTNWSLQDLLNKCKNLTNKNNFCLSYEDSVYWVSPYLSYFGGGILDKNLNLIIDSKQSQTALKLYKDLKNYHYAPQKSEIGSSTLAQMFLDEKIVFYLSGHWLYPKISEKAKFNWAVINFPYGISPQLVDTSGWAVAKASEHKVAAVKLVQFLANKESSDYFAETGLIVPARKDSAKILNNNLHNEKIFLEVIQNSVNTPVRKDYNKITDKLNKELDL